ncbi:MAG: hypothetical protein AAF641_04725 [Pseudomonadota bacterium]
MTTVTARRLPDNPILTRFAERRVGANVNGPSLIAVPDWVPGRLARYYLYFAHHLGGFIRMAYADHLGGPWTVHGPGVLDLGDVPYLHDHLASPDVHVDEAAGQIVMYFHGVSDPLAFSEPPQVTCRATSSDGLRFVSEEARLGASYFRVWRQDGWYYALSLGGQLWRSQYGRVAFEEGTILKGLPDDTRHLAVMRKDGKTWIAWSVIGDCPERIFMGCIEGNDWTDWRVNHVQEVLRPEQDWEGRDTPLEPSLRGLAEERVHQLRDPAFFSEAGQDYLLYAIAGEAGIAIATLDFEGEPA